MLPSLDYLVDCFANLLFTGRYDIIHLMAHLVDIAWVVSNPVDNKVRSNSAHAHIENGFHFPSY
tara:strand:+ start:2477 stop:2668 length:192 start_codon:yes stop_codon:yes gene_type:complete